MVSSDISLPHRLVVAGALAFAVIALAGCGSSKSSSTKPAAATTTTSNATSAANATATATTTTTAPSGAPTKAEYIAKGDKVCSDYRAAIAPFEKRLDAAKTFDEQAKVLKEMIPIVERSVANFRTLQPPPADKAVHEQYVEKQEQSVFFFRQVQKAAEEHDALKAKTYLDDGAKNGERAKGLAQGYGFKVCGSEKS